MRKMMIEGYKRFVKRGIWTIDNADYLRRTNRITDEEYAYITEGLATVSELSDIDHGLNYTYEMWDKVSPINGVPAEEVLKSSGLRADEDIIKVKLGNKVVELSDIETLRANHNISLDATIEQVAEEHVAIMEEIKNTPHVDINEVNTAMSLMHDYQMEDNMARLIDLLTDIKTLLTKE